MKRVWPRKAVRDPLLEGYRGEISRCVKCGSCGAVCPTSLSERSESFSARGRMALVKGVLEKRLTVSAVFRERLATCTGCLACEASCPSRVPVAKIIDAAKQDAAGESGLGIVNRVVSTSLKHTIVMRSFAWSAPFVLHYSRGSMEGRETGPRRRETGDGSVTGAKRRGRVALFPGCVITYFQRDIGRAAIAVLNETGYDVVIPKGLQCCGRPLLSLGDRKSAEELALQNCDLLTGLSVDAVVTACASCGMTFKRDYPALLTHGAKMPNIVDIHEILYRELSNVCLRAVQKGVTFHDPCHLGRGQGLSGTARDVLRSVPGLTLIEMKNADQCCGFGGTMRITRSKLSDAIARDKAAMIMATGASAVVTGCPSCRMQITEALQRAGSRIDVVHTVQILEQALALAQKVKG